MHRGLYLVGIAAFTLVLFAPAGCQAQHKAPDGVMDEELEKEAAQVNRDLFRPAMDLGIWTLVVFLVLLAVLGKFAWKPMMQGLEQRERAIHSALQEAQQAREEATRLSDQLEDKLRKANEQARSILDEARRAGERTTTEMIAEAHKKIQAEQERLQRELNLAYSQARRDLQTEAAQLATLVASKVIRRQMNHDDHRQLVEEALAELRSTSDGRQQMARV